MSITKGIEQMKYELSSINIGTVQTDIYCNKEIKTGIYKKPIKEKVFVSFLQITGDEQADLINHGGRDKAICVYPEDHFPFWRNELDVPISSGAFGENITIAKLTEENTFIGDIFKLGDAVLQVSQPRQPCFKVGNKLKKEILPITMQKTGFTGFYFRVLQEGYIEAGQSLQLIKRHPKNISISFVNDVKYHDKNNKQKLAKVIELEELSAGWRESFKKRLEK